MNSHGALFFSFYFSPDNDEHGFRVDFPVRSWLFAKCDPLFSWCRSFEFTEKKEVDKYYPQYYHKIDKVKKNPS
jgi:hypothetical protein